MRISDWSSDVCSSDLAASSGDGGYLEPAFYPDVSGSYDAVFGGPPTDPVALMHYRRLSPSLRADKVCGAVLQQVAAPLVPSIDFHTALRKAGVPAELSLYPGDDAASAETHIFHKIGRASCRERVCT